MCVLCAIHSSTFLTVFLSLCLGFSITNRLLLQKVQGDQSQSSGGLSCYVVGEETWTLPGGGGGGEEGRELINQG